MRYMRRRRRQCRDKNFDVTHANSCATRKERLSRIVISCGEQKGRRPRAVSWSNAGHTSRRTARGRFSSVPESVKARTPAGKRLENSKGSRRGWDPILSVARGYASGSELGSKETRTSRGRNSSIHKPLPRHGITLKLLHSPLTG